MAVIRLGGREILFISVYGFANRYREGKRPNDLLLASLIPAITEIGLPFCILGDFNEPPSKLPSFQFFRDLGAREAFEWYHAKTGILLPATCAGSTRNDTAILHPWLLQHVQSMQVSTDVIFEPHSPLCIELQFSDVQDVNLSWKLPKSWAAFSPGKQQIHDAYIPVDFEAIEHKFQHDPCKIVDSAFSTWSGAVETAIDKALFVWLIATTLSGMLMLLSMHHSEEDASLRRNFLKTKNLLSNQTDTAAICHLVKFSL